MSDKLVIPRIGNAAGTCKTERHFELLLQSAADIITIGPITLHPREYNPGNNEYQNNIGGSINSHGLPSEGKIHYRKHLPEFLRMAEDFGKLVSVSLPPIDKVEGSERDDIEIVTAMCLDAGVRIIEMNAGCGNVWKGSKQKRILSFQPEALEHMIDKLLGIIRRAAVHAELRVKLSPYSDPVLLAEIASMLFTRNVAVVTSNTFANAYMFREDIDHRPAIEFGKHLGGYGGKGMKPIALGQVAQFREYLPDHKIIGVSGIENGRDMWEFDQVGADEMQIGSAWYFTEDPRIFGDTLSQYIDIREQQS